MTVDDLIAHYGSGPKAAAALELTTPTPLYQWRAAGRIPKLRQFQIEHITRGALKADEPAPMVISAADSVEP